MNNANSYSGIQTIPSLAGCSSISTDWPSHVWRLVTMRLGSVDCLRSLQMDLTMPNGHGSMLRHPSCLRSPPYHLVL